MIDNDAKVLKIISTIESRPALKLSSLIEEALDLLRANTFPAPTNTAIIKARAKLANSRSKLIENRVEILKELALLNGALEDLTNYILSKYHNYFSNNIKNQKSRDAVVSKALSPIQKKIRKLDSALAIINHVIADFDSRSFAIRDVIEALKMGEREI